MRKPLKAGLLPLYLSLYDESMPERRGGFADFLELAATRLSSGGMTVARAGICCQSAEIREAVGRFESDGVDAIVTLHLAYSPSMEAAPVLAETSLPVVMLDTTMDQSFGPLTPPDRIMYNHGIHGVQDLASVLRRMGKPYVVVAGHVDEPNLFHRAESYVRGFRAAGSLHGTRVLRIGDSFEGMGDFAPGDGIIADVLGLELEQLTPVALAAALPPPSAEEISAEIVEDSRQFTVEAPPAVHEDAIRAGMVLRTYLEQGNYSAFSMNFLSFQESSGILGTVPFLEAAKAMARAVGYAGEGDVLTAGMVGALMQGYDDVTFTEMFCPDWERGSVFLSHMGEVNPRLAAAPPRLIEKPFPFTPARNPAILTCGLREGQGHIVNMVPGPDGTFSLIVAPVAVLDPGSEEQMGETIRGWVKPISALGDFLEQYSRAGGTHHGALIYGATTESLVAVGASWGCEPVTIE